ncbi:MAG: lipoate protein ligase C-terminal domain-containing protein [Candidatus Hadarchaeales archaeon]
MRAELKAPKGVIKVELETAAGKIQKIRITGDFFLYPEEALEKLEESLKNVPLEEAELMKVVRNFFESERVQAPMLGPEHFVEAILRAARG